MSDRVEPHYASDRRCYNGAPCSDLHREWKSKDDARTQIKSLGGSITYFPAGCYYVGFHNMNIITEDCQCFWTCYNKMYDYFNSTPMEKTDANEETTDSKDQTGREA